MTAPWYRFDPATRSFTLTLHVQPGAKRTEAAGLHGDAVKIKLAAPPVEGKANETLLAFLAEIFAVPPRQVILKRGKRSREKVVEISGSKVAPDALVKK